MKVAILLSVLITLPAHAWDKKPIGQANADSRALAASHSDSDARSTSDATATGGNATIGGVQSSATLGDVRSSATVGSSTSNVAISTPDKLRIENTPDAHTYTPMSGDDCVAHITAGGGVPGAGLTVGFPKSDPDCRLLRLYDRQMQAGRYAAAAKTICATKGLAKVYGYKRKTKDRSECVEDNTYSPPPPPAIPDYTPALERQSNRLDQQEDALKRQAQILRGLSANDAKQSKLLQSMPRDHHDRPQIATLKAKVETYGD